MLDESYENGDIITPNKCDGSSVVECFLPKEEVAGSNPVHRSKINRDILACPSEALAKEGTPLLR